ncbi:MAG TPA: hypothetical protein VIU61_07825 [Kofleriaceae bacterium]
MSALRLFVVTIALAACGGAKKPAASPTATPPMGAGSAESGPATDAPADPPAPQAPPPSGGGPTKSSSDPCMGGE